MDEHEKEPAPGERLYTPEDIERASQILVSSSYVTALMGAGLSAESGIPTFRGPGGLWTKVWEPSNTGYQEFVHDPGQWWREQFRDQEQIEGPRAEFRLAIQNARPNSGHYALADLESLGVLKYTITQNVDDLHYVAGSRRVAEIHGNRTKVRCIDCNLRFPRHELLVYEDELPPRCPECGGIIKGDGVMFGEPIPRDVLEVCLEQVDLSDCMMLIGTSATVYPAAGFPEAVRARGGHLIEVNPFLTSLSSDCDVVLRGASGEVLAQVVAQVRQLLKERAG